MRLLHGCPYEDGLLKLDKITLESYHFSVPRGLWSVQWVCNQVTDLLGLTNGKELRTKRMTTAIAFTDDCNMIVYVDWEGGGARWIRKRN